MSRIIQIINDDWSFHLGDISNGEDVNLNAEEWPVVQVPHDWTIEGPFKQFRDENWFAFENLDHRIGYLPQGIGWYRKEFFVPMEYANKRVTIQFDGIYRNSDVWINGQHLGHRPYGYSTFYYDLTPHLKFGQSNVIAVRVNNKGVSSRWYSGSGIYRKVSLIITNSIHVGHWGTYWTTPKVSKDAATVHIKTTLVNESREKNPKVTVTTEITYGSTLISSKTTEVDCSQKETIVDQDIEVIKPHLWSPLHPNMYKIITSVKKDKNLVDTYETPLGIRYFRWDPNLGFFINDVPMKIKGVCLHHDNGCLGAKEHVRAVERKLEIMGAMGCNAIRTSHNPPSQELLEMCDKMGFLVMDEAFDEWTMMKTPEGYWKYFNEWYERDVCDYVHRDRNHPCVIMWSCGNEVAEQKYEKGIAVLKNLIEVFHREDPTRPVTQGCNHPKEANKNGFADLLDIMGYNYYGDGVYKQDKDGLHFRYEEEHRTYPNRILIGSENVSARVTRGVYHIEMENKFGSAGLNWEKIADDFQCSSYDMKSETALMSLKSGPYVSGMFTWEGFDYIGEPTPYPWPCRSSEYGIVDLAGFPKDIYYLYQTQWLDKPIVHIMPHWNWHKGMLIPVWVYTNGDSVELFLNGKSLGEHSFKEEDFTDLLHLMWDVDYEPGELKAVAKKDGKKFVETSIITSDVPFQLKMSADRSIISKERDLCFITVSVHDINGIIVPTANNLVTFTIKGPGKIIGVDNGNPISHESFVDQQIHIFNGLALVVVESSSETIGEKQDIVLSANSLELKPAKISIQIK